MTTGCVLDVLIYVYDHYMMSDPAEVPARRQIFSALARKGFTLGEVAEAMEWLSVLAAGSEGPVAAAPAASERAVRVFADGELWRLSDECRGFLTRLDRDGVLTPEQRELVIERTLALDVVEPTLEQLKWVVLLALSVQPGEDAALARFEALMASERQLVRH
ncbi:MAG: Smg family protein [Steroidobacteraceae bacterium]|jgi:Smg protein